MKLSIVILTCLLAGLLFIAQSPQQIAPHQASQLASRNHPSKLDSALSHIVTQVNRDLPNSVDQVQVTLELSVPAVSNDSVLKKVQDLGGQIQTHAGNQVQALIPANTLNELAAEPSINYIHLPNRPYPDAVSEGVAAINAVTFRDYHGADGTGVKIAILDQGFAGYPTLQLSGELPATVTTLSFRTDGVVDGITDHGTACAEIIYDIAPGAEYYFVTYDTATEYVSAVLYLMDEEVDVDIISHSLSFFNDGPYDGTSAVSAMITQARSDGIFWVNSAGDYAQRHWEGLYDGNEQNILHVWDGSTETVNNIGFLEEFDEIEVYLSWNDWPTSNNNYDLFLMINDGGEWDFVKYSSTVQSGFEPPVEMITYTTSLAAEYGFTIYNDQGAAAPRYFELFSPTHDLAYYTPSSSIPNAGDAAGAFTVGAVSVADYSASGFRAYSSQGPTNSTGGGSPDYAAGSRIKPDIAAPDGVSTETISAFQGTSASAPHAAGAAALYASSYLDSNGVLPDPDQIQMYLEECADRVNDWGTDIDGIKNNEFGAGGLYMCDIPTGIVLQNFSASSAVSPGITLVLVGFLLCLACGVLSSSNCFIDRLKNHI